MPLPGTPALHRPTLFCLHFLGGSAREWRWVETRLAGFLRCVTIDLPGFGEAAQLEGYAVAQMADHVAKRIRAEAPGRWFLAGHSMGAKIAAVLARRAEDSAAGLQGLAGLVLLAGSPPGPEPMQESQRRTMMGWFSGDADTDCAEAVRYIEQNMGETPHPAMQEQAAIRERPPIHEQAAIHEQAVDDVLRSHRAAWLAWLDQGSREDWSARIGVLQTPALLVAGERDSGLGPAVQRSRMLPHFAHARLVTLAGAGHLLPMERPEEVARLIAEHVQAQAPDDAAACGIGAAYRALLESDRVSAATRAALLARAVADDPSYCPGAITPPQLQTLRAMLDRVLPQSGPARIDIAARIDASLLDATGDGWRFARLPCDRDAYGGGLDTIDRAARLAFGAGFADLAVAAQDGLLQRAAAGELDCAPRPGLLDAPQMQLWFEDLRADAVQIYVSHPATLDRMGYGGIANGGDTARQSGFVAIGAGEREPWEPLPWETQARSGDAP